MDPLYTTSISTQYGEKQIAAFVCDILHFDQDIDILTTSAFHRSYAPTPKTLFSALWDIGISVHSLSINPVLDLRKLCNVWLSEELSSPNIRIGRIGCVEMMYQNVAPHGLKLDELAMLRSIKAYFQMLDTASYYGIKMDTIALPLLGAGSQNISDNLTIIPIIHESIEFLKRNYSVKRIFFIERNQGKAFRIAQALANSYAINAPASMTSWNHQETNPMPNHGQASQLAFISYSSPNRNVADCLCAKLEARGMKVWYAPRNVHNDYASSIAAAISKATHFIVILSKNSMTSEHVLNEIDLAFKKLPNKIKFKPLRIDEEDLAPAFDYYLSRQHWMDAHIPPLERRLDEFVEHVIKDID